MPLRILVLFFLFLMTTIAPTSADFGISVDDSFDYTLLQSIGDSGEDVAVYLGDNGTELQIPVGEVFSVSPVSLEIDSNAFLGDYLNIEITYNGSSVQVISYLISGFFIDLNFSDYRALHPEYSTSTTDGESSQHNTRTLIETDTEIGYSFKSDSIYHNTDSSGNSRTSEYVIRYSKADGVLNYQFSEYKDINFDSQGEPITTQPNTHLLSEYIRVGSNFPKTNSHLKISVTSLWIIGVVTIGLLHRYKRLHN